MKKRRSDGVLSSEKIAYLKSFRFARRWRRICHNVCGSPRVRRRSVGPYRPTECVLPPIPFINGRNLPSLPPAGNVSARRRGWL